MNPISGTRGSFRAARPDQRERRGRCHRPRVRQHPSEPVDLRVKHGLRGPNYSVVSACATGNNNIGDAFMLIRLGHADAIVTGGSEASICTSVYFKNAGWL